MWAVSLIFLALVSGFLAGHGFELPLDMVPLVVAIVIGFIGIKAGELLYDRQ